MRGLIYLLGCGSREKCPDQERVCLKEHGSNLCSNFIQPYEQKGLSECNKHFSENDQE